MGQATDNCYFTAPLCKCKENIKHFDLKNTYSVF